MPLKSSPIRPKLTIGNARDAAATPATDPMPFSLQRLLHPLTPHPLRLATAMRIEVRPPMARRNVQTWRRRLREWLTTGFGERYASTAFRDSTLSPRSDAALRAARDSFRGALHDIGQSIQTAASLDHIRAARSLHELWHLRAEVFSLVSRHRDQGEAARRLTRLDRHFDNRVSHARFAGASGGDSR